MLQSPIQKVAARLVCFEYFFESWNRWLRRPFVLSVDNPIDKWNGFVVQRVLLEVVIAVVEPFQQLRRLRRKVAVKVFVLVVRHSSFFGEGFMERVSEFE